MKAKQLPNFYVRSSTFAALSLAGAILNYALYPVLAHLLTTTQFGNFTVILALSNQILAILLSFNVISITLVKNYSEKTAHNMAETIQKLLMRFFIVVSLVILIASPVLKSHLKVDSVVSFFILALMLLISVPIVIWMGYLQGHKRLINVGSYTFFSALVKFLFAAGLAVKFGSIGALWGVIVGTFAGLLLLWFSSDIKLPKIKSVFSKIEDKDLAPVRLLTKFVLSATIVVGGLGILQNIDITFAKLFFNPAKAGVYSGVSILSNSIFYIGFLLIWIILPEIDPANKSNNKRVITTAYKLMGLMTVGVIAVETWFRGALIQALLGHNFANQGNILIYATLFQISVLAVTLYAFYQLVLRSSKGLWLALSVIVPCLTIPWFFNNSPQQMVLSLWLSVVLGSAVYFVINLARASAYDTPGTSAN